MAAAGDAAAMLAIYAPFVETTAVTFEYVVPPVDELAARVGAVTAQWPWLVLERAGRVVGYAYASAWRTRAAYQWAVETTVYVHPDDRRRGIGLAVYRSLLACLQVQGYRLALGGITLPNPASIALHERLGFRQVAVHRACGHKLGAWHDVGFWELELAAREDAAPTAPRPPAALAGDAAWIAALASGLAG